MKIFTVPREKFDESNLSKEMIRLLINKHISYGMELHKLHDYYEGRHKILDNPASDGPNNRLVCNHAKDIADTASSYFVGEPISYKSDQDIQPLTEALESAGADEIDGDNGLDLSIYGVSYEYIYAKENSTQLVCKNLKPEHTFMVYDDTIEQNELFLVYYFVRHDDSEQLPVRYSATVLTQNYKYELDIVDSSASQVVSESPVPHFFGEIPAIEYLNNKMGIGDFELQIPLIDAYNALMSDRVNDKEQFIDSILAIYGTLLSDEDYAVEGDGKGSEEAMTRLKKRKLLELPDGTKAEYITRTFDESGVEILRKAIEQDIHKFSQIPCMTDDSFGGNVSGVAMEFKLLGMENITRIKTRYYKKGLRKRLRLFSTWLGIKGKQVDTSGIKMVFTRSMPMNLLEISQWVSNLWGKVSKKTLLSQIPFVDDVDAELEAVQKDNEESVKQQQEMFGYQANTPPPDNQQKVDDINVKS